MLESWRGFFFQLCKGSCNIDYFFVNYAYSDVICVNFIHYDFYFLLLMGLVIEEKLSEVVVFLHICIIGIKKVNGRVV